MLSTQPSFCWRPIDDSHVGELVKTCINLLLPRMEVAEHTGSIHRIVARLAMKLDGAGDVPMVLLLSPIVRTTTSLTILSPGNVASIATLAGHLLDVLLDFLQKGADIKGLTKGGFANRRSRVAF
jgi:hypothetical protein